jgi:serine/threonine protein kinase
VISVFRHGWLLKNSLYFVDMELGAFSLRDFINSRIKSAIGPSFLDPRPIHDELRCLKFWCIFKQVVQGLQFIHREKEVHRDMKPENGKFLFFEILNGIVLFCVHDRAWKITDFGLTSEATTMKAYSTRSANGTGGYRSPELVSKTSVVSKESDIFALGCIVYELASNEKAFSDDIDVFQYVTNGQGPKPLSIDGDFMVKTSIRVLLDAMLNVQWWKRPSVADILHAISLLSVAGPELSIPVQLAIKETHMKISSTSQLKCDSVLWEQVLWQPFW